MSENSYNSNVKTTIFADLLNTNSKSNKKKNKTDAPDYYAKKQREYRRRKYANDKSCWKKCFYAIEINGKKYYYMSPKDIKWEKIDRKLIDADVEGNIFVKAF